MDIRAWLQNTDDRRPPDDTALLHDDDYTANHIFAIPDQRLRCTLGRDVDREDGLYFAEEEQPRRADTIPDNVHLMNDSDLPTDEDSISSSTKYRRRRRRKTRLDRYDLKISKPAKERRCAEKAVRPRRSRRDVSDGTLGIVRSFELNARCKQRRLTLEPSRQNGLSTHARSAKQSAGLPDLSFTGLGFLQPAQPDDNLDIRQSAAIENRRVQDAEISEYFQGRRVRSPEPGATHRPTTSTARPPSLRTSVVLSQMARQYSSDKLRESLPPVRDVPERSADAAMSSTSMPLPGLYTKDQTPAFQFTPARKSTSASRQSLERVSSILRDNAQTRRVAAVPVRDLARPRIDGSGSHVSHTMNDHEASGGHLRHFCKPHNAVTSPPRQCDLSTQARRIAEARDPFHDLPRRGLHTFNPVYNGGMAAAAAEMQPSASVVRLWQELTPSDQPLPRCAVQEAHGAEQWPSSAGPGYPLESVPALDRQGKTDIAQMASDETANRFGASWYDAGHDMFSQEPTSKGTSPIGLEGFWRPNRLY